MFMRLYNSFIQKLNNVKLKNKLMLSYSILIVIPLSILTVVSYTQVSKYIEQQMLYSSKQVFEQTDSFLNYKMEKIINVANIISSDSNVHEILTKPITAYPLPDQLKDMEYLQNYLTSYQKTSDAYKVNLYVDDNYLFSAERTNLFAIKDCMNLKCYRNFIKNHNRTTFTPVSENPAEFTNKVKTISLFRGVKSFSDYESYVGYLKIDILESNIQNIIKNANTVKNGVAYLLNTDGYFVTYSNWKLANRWRFTPDYCRQLSDRNDNWSIITVNNEKLFVGCQLIKDTDWYIVSVVPYNTILSSGKMLRNQIVLVMFIIVFFSYIVAYFISTSTTKRISQLTQRMKKVQNDDLNAIIATSSKDEVGILIENYNYMLKKIEILVEKQYQSGLEVKNSELKALQAQINPHFLYNTLDLINWTAIKNNVPEISTIVKSLAKFYKLSLNKGRDIVSIRDEIEHVTIYTALQNMRFENRIKLKTEIDECLYEYSIIKTLLQPIVENSILHGIVEKVHKSGTIIISGKLENGCILLSIKDDGVGMDQNQVLNIFQETSADPNKGYGLKNINTRIKIHYGEKYGIHISSSPEGTDVLICIPAIPYKNQ